MCVAKPTTHYAPLKPTSRNTKETMFENISKRKHAALVGALFAGGMLFLLAAILVFSKYLIAKGDDPAGRSKAEQIVQPK
jgi:hypothetical protein